MSERLFRHSSHGLIKEDKIALSSVTSRDNRVIDFTRISIRDDGLMVSLEQSANIIMRSCAHMQVHRVLSPAFDSLLVMGDSLERENG